MSCLLEVVDRMSIALDVRHVPLLTATVELSALQTQPQILGQFAVLALHVLCISVSGRPYRHRRRDKDPALRKRRSEDRASDSRPPTCTAPSLLRPMRGEGSALRDFDTS